MCDTLSSEQVHEYRRASAQCDAQWGRSLLAWSWRSQLVARSDCNEVRNSSSRQTQAISSPQALVVMPLSITVCCEDGTCEYNGRRASKKMAVEFKG